MSLRQKISPCSSVGKESAQKVGDPDSTPGLGRSPREGNGKPLQYSWLENPMDKGAWRASPWGHKSKTRLGDKTTTMPKMNLAMDLTPFTKINSKETTDLNVKLKTTKSCAQLCQTLGPHRLWPARLFCPWNFPGKNTGVDCHFLLQGIFQTQGSNLYLFCFLHWQADFLPLAPPRKQRRKVRWLDMAVTS